MMVRAEEKTSDNIHLVRACELYTLGGDMGIVGADVQGVRVEKVARLGSPYRWFEDKKDKYDKSFNHIHFKFSL